MKRHFMMSLKALCTGVMTLCVASLSLTSCYDDSELNSKIDELENEVSGLDARLQAVEALTAQLEALTARVDALYTLKFQVTATNELQYSFDGGTTWVSTGIVLAKELECDCEEPVKVSLVDNGDSVTIKVGDQEFTIEKPQEIVFEIRAGKVYFDYEQTLSIGVKSVGIEDMTVMATPKGWWAEITDDGKIEVTAPSEETAAPVKVGEDMYGDPIYEPNVSAVDGYIKVHACAADGKCMVGKFPVVVAKDGLLIEAYMGTAFINCDPNSDLQVVYGISTKKNYLKEAKTVIDAINAGNRDGYAGAYYWSDEHPEGISIADAVGGSLVEGEEYVIWALKFDPYGYYRDITYSTADLVLKYYSLPSVTVTVDEDNSNPWCIMVDYKVEGADSYLTVACPDEYLDNISVESFLYAYQDYSEGGWELIGKIHDHNYSGALSLVCDGTNSAMGGEEKLNQNWTVYVLPLDGRPADKYDVEDVKVLTFKSKNVEAGGSVKAEAKQVNLEHMNPHTSLAVELTKPTGEWICLYSDYLTPLEFEGKSDADLVAALLEVCYPIEPKSMSEWTAYCPDLTPETTMYYVAFFVDKSGKYGQLAKLKLTTDAIQLSDIVFTEPYETNLSDGALVNTDTFTLVPSTSIDAQKFRYILRALDYYNPYEGKTAEEMAQEITFSESAIEVSNSDLVAGKIAVSGHSYGKDYYLAILPYDEDGAPGRQAVIFEYNVDLVIKNLVSDPVSFVGAPEINFTIPEMTDGLWEPYYWHSGAQYVYFVNCAINPGSGTEVAAAIVDPASLAADYNYDLQTKTATEIAEGLWEKSIPGQQPYTCVTSSKIDTPLTSFYVEDAISPVILVSWKDADNNYYYKEISVADEFAFMKRMLDHNLVGVQYAFDWEAFDNVPAVLDFDPETGKCYVAYDPSVMGAPEGTPYQVYNSAGYKFVPETMTKGKLQITIPNMFGEETTEFDYEFTSEGCNFAFGDMFVGQDVTGVLTNVEVDTTGGIMQ